MKYKTYLGDSVYALFDGSRFEGFAVLLTTENGLPSDPSNRIYLKPEVLGRLIRSVEELKGRVQ